MPDPIPPSRPERTAAARPEATPSAGPEPAHRSLLGPVLAVELGRQWLSPGAIVVYVLAVLPVLVGLGVALGRIVARAHGLHTFDTAPRIYPDLFEGLILRTAIFFGCAWLFIRVFRAENAARSLHYAFLTPTPRPVLLWGKYLAALIGAAVLFAGSSLLTLALIASGPVPTGQAAAYAGVAILACAAYGGLFLLLGLLFRNPVIPVLVLFGWEAILLFLPPWLQHVTVLFYLNSLLPVPLTAGSVAVVAAPAGTAAAIIVLLVAAAVLTALAALRATGMEIAYARED
ncbi:MAG: hypothetical protein ACRD2E_00765 [Terriglobales bacterium]